MKIEIDNKLEEVTPEEYAHLKQAKAWDRIESAAWWIAFCFMLVCCNYCYSH